MGGSGMNKKERNHPLTYYKDDDIKVVKFNIAKLVLCLGFLYGFVAIYLQVELYGLLSLLALSQYLISLSKKWRVRC
jgi:hypothetical protein